MLVCFFNREVMGLNSRLLNSNSCLSSATDLPILLMIILQNETFFSFSFSFKLIFIGI